MTLVPLINVKTLHFVRFIAKRATNANAKSLINRQSVTTDAYFCIAYHVHLVYYLLDGPLALATEVQTVAQMAVAAYHDIHVVPSSHLYHDVAQCLAVEIETVVAPAGDRLHVDIAVDA